MHWVNVYCLVCYAPVYRKTMITNINEMLETRRILKQNKYAFKRITLTQSLYNCNCRLDFSLQKWLRRDRLYKNTPSGGYKGLEMCLRSIPAEPFKILNQLTYSYLFIFFSDQRNLFVCFDDREISTWEIVTCSLLSHYILTPNELICLTSAAIRRSVVF